MTMTTDMRDEQQLEEMAVECSTKQLPAVEENCPPISAEQNGMPEGVEEAAEVETTITTTNAMIKIPRADSKLILQNMEEVLKSVKKKHRAKHKRKRELKKLALLEAAAANKVNNDSAVAAIGVKKRSNKKPLQMAALENEAATSTHNSILQHFARTPKKNQTTEPHAELLENEQVIDLDMEADMLQHEEVQMESEAVLKRKTNAFEVMMNARNKSIGGNSPGKEVPPTEETNVALNATKLKCKQLLQNLAERKGASKRKLDEDARAAYVEQQLENRAKR